MDLTKRIIPRVRWQHLPLAKRAVSLLGVLLLAVTLQAHAQDAGESIEIPDDAPEALSPEEAVNSFQLSPGFRIELVASEPLINDPTDICWDAKGRLYVTELLGYNLPGQLEIEAMNKTGVLDTVVQRVEAAEEYRIAAEEETYTVVKRLSDTDGDGVMDDTEVFADRLPHGYGCTAARGGLIVAGQTEILYIADRDEDGTAEVRDTLFSGWRDYRLERGVNFPRRGPDGWIYFSSSAGIDSMSGPYLQDPVALPDTDFRIRADGSMIEPVTGATGTLGHAWTADGYRFVGGGSPAPYAIPIPWKYLERNPNFSISNHLTSGSDYSTVYPIAPPHPWRLFRSYHPEWRAYYSRYGTQEVTPLGYFTGDCCPLVYRDSLFPSEFHGNLFVSSPAQSLVHRAVVEVNGTELRIRRGPESATNKEFLASTDSWFTPIGLRHGPDGSLYVVDFYREIVEDYTAIPRPMQQKYRLMDGADRGRIWRVSPDTSENLGEMTTPDLTNADLGAELDSPHYWRRKTARRLLYEQQGDEAPALRDRQLTLRELRRDTPPNDFIRTLHRLDVQLKDDPATARTLAEMSHDISNERMLLQLALSLGYSGEAEVLEALISLARNHADIRWMPEAILSGVRGRAQDVLEALLAKPGATGHLLLDPLAASIATSSSTVDLSQALHAILQCKSPALQVRSLEGINRNVQRVDLDQAGTDALHALLESTSPHVREQSIQLAVTLYDADSGIEDAATALTNPRLSTERHLSAVDALTSSRHDLSTRFLITEWKFSTPKVKSSILETLVSQNSRHTALTAAISNKTIPVASLTRGHKAALLESADADRHTRLERLFNETTNLPRRADLSRYVSAVEDETGTVDIGREVYRQLCTSCHAVGEMGTAFGPDLREAVDFGAESFVRSVLSPNEAISPGYELYTVMTHDNQEYSGVIVDETEARITLRQVGGIEHSIERTDIKEIASTSASLMPSYEHALTPGQVNDIIEWLQSSP